MRVSLILLSVLVTGCLATTKPPIDFKSRATMCLPNVLDNYDPSPQSVPYYKEVGTECGSRCLHDLKCVASYIDVKAGTCQIFSISSNVKFIKKAGASIRERDSAVWIKHEKVYCRKGRYPFGVTMKHDNGQKYKLVEVPDVSLTIQPVN